MTQTPVVTIVTPTYDRAALLPDTIASILSQTYRHFEYLVVDDGSTDETADVVRRFADPRLTYARHDNMGESATVNVGWARARGRYFAVVSSDDPMLPAWLERSVAFLDSHPDAIVSYPDWHVIDEHGQVTRTITTYEYAAERLVGWLHTIPGPGALIRRERLRDVQRLRNPRYRYASDLDTWLMLAPRGPFARIPEVLAQWRAHPTSLTLEPGSHARAQEFLDIARAFHERPDVPDALRALRPFTMSRAYWYASWSIMAADATQADAWLRTSYAVSRHDPPGLPRELQRALLPLPSQPLRWGARLARGLYARAARLLHGRPRT